MLGIYKSMAYWAAGDIGSCIDCLNGPFLSKYGCVCYTLPQNTGIYGNVKEFSVSFSLLHQEAEAVQLSIGKIFQTLFGCYLDSICLSSLYFGAFDSLLFDRTNSMGEVIEPETNLVQETIIDLCRRGLVLGENEDEFNFLNLPLINFELISKMDEDFYFEFKEGLFENLKRAF